MELKLVSLNIGLPRKLDTERPILSAIGKTRQAEATLRSEGFRGDDVADKKHHGGADRAVSFYPYGHYEGWSSLYGRQIAIPAFGENITISGLTENTTFVGDVLQIGEAIVEVSQGRIPCSTISAFNRERNMLKKVVETGQTGFFARVLKEGAIRVCSNIQLIDRKQSAVSILHIHRLLFHDRSNKELALRVLELDRLAPVMRAKVEKLLKN